EIVLAQPTAAKAPRARRVLAHELAHTVQQGRDQAGLSVVSSGRDAEQEADYFADSAIRNSKEGFPIISYRSATPLIQRTPASQSAGNPPEERLFQQAKKAVDDREPKTLTAIVLVARNMRLLHALGKRLATEGYSPDGTYLDAVVNVLR